MWSDGFAWSDAVLNDDPLFSLSANSSSLGDDTAVAIPEGPLVEGAAGNDRN